MVIQQDPSERQRGAQMDPVDYQALKRMKAESHATASTAAKHASQERYGRSDEDRAMRNLQFEEHRERGAEEREE